MRSNLSIHFEDDKQDLQENSLSFNVLNENHFSLEIIHHIGTLRNYHTFLTSQSFHQP